METYEECYNRIKHFVNNIKTKYNFENVLVITHNCSASFIEDVVLKINKDFSDDVFLRKFKNAEVKKFII